MQWITLVDGTDLAAWGNRLDAQSQLPHLLRRLILATLRKPRESASVRVRGCNLLDGTASSPWKRETPSSPTESPVGKWERTGMPRQRPMGITRRDPKI